MVIDKFQAVESHDLHSHKRKIRSFERPDTRWFVRLEMWNVNEYLMWCDVGGYTCLNDIYKWSDVTM